MRVPFERTTSGMLVAAGFLVTFLVLLLANHTYFGTSAIHALGFAVWWMFPLLAYSVLSQSRVRIAVEAAYLVAGGTLLAMIYSDQHSTVGIGLVFGGAYLWAGVLAVLGVESVVRRLAARRTPPRHEW
jgi:hypothetical protein